MYWSGKDERSGGIELGRGKAKDLEVSRTYVGAVVVVGDLWQSTYKSAVIINTARYSTENRPMQYRRK